MFIISCMFLHEVARRSRSSHLRCSIKKLCLFRDLRADEYDQILRLWLKVDETKTEKGSFITITMANFSLTHV